MVFCPITLTALASALSKGKILYAGKMLVANEVCLWAQRKVLLESMFGLGMFLAMGFWTAFVRETIPMRLRPQELQRWKLEAKRVLTNTVIPGIFNVWAVSETACPDMAQILDWWPEEDEVPSVAVLLGALPDFGESSNLGRVGKLWKGIGKKCDEAKKKCADAWAKHVARPLPEQLGLSNDVWNDLNAFLDENEEEDAAHWTEVAQRWLKARDYSESGPVWRLIALAVPCEGQDADVDSEDESGEEETTVPRQVRAKLQDAWKGIEQLFEDKWKNLLQNFRSGENAEEKEEVDEEQRQGILEKAFMTLAERALDAAASPPAAGDKEECEAEAEVVVVDAGLHRPHLSVPIHWTLPSLPSYEKNRQHLRDTWERNKMCSSRAKQSLQNG